MKRWSVFLFYLLLLQFPGFSQQVIKGTVVDRSAGSPVGGSSIFLSGTSIGTISDKSGQFELKNIPPGRYELVISSVGYETNVFSFSTEQLPLQVRIEMVVKVRELANVIVEPFVEEGWDKWGSTFLANFTGQTPNALRCRIRNTESIHFRYYKKSNRLIAYSDEPIIIENRALGYNISYQLEEFEVNFRNQTSLFTGYPFFEDIYRNAERMKRRWNKARDKAYYGSMIHFMRSLYADSLMQNDFEVRRMKRIPNLEKERVKALYRSGGVSIITIGTSPRASQSIVTSGLADSLRKDSVDYYQRVMGQKDYIEVYGNAQLTGDSLFIRSVGQYKELFFTGYLYITFKGEPEDKAYLAFHKENRSPVFQRSYITLLAGNPIEIDINGNYFPPQELFSMAYWGWSEKIAEMLPSDYEPGDSRK